MPRHSERTYAVCDEKALLGNLDALRPKNPPKKIIAVVKDSCYGCGEKLCGILCDKVDALGVSTAEESIRLRKLCPKIPILVFGYVPLKDVPRLIGLNVSLSVYSLSYAEKLNETAALCGGEITAHLKINTGMNRLGVKYDDFGALKKILSMPYIDFRGIFSHLAESGDEDFSEIQNARFSACVAFCQSSGYAFEFVHLASTYAADRDYCGDTVRLGYGLYGYGGNLEPVLSWYARVVQIRTVEDEYVSYGLTYKADGKRRIATIAVGYGDGYPRSLTNCGKVLWNGVFLPITGRVCMDMTMIDVTDAPTINEGSYVTLIGKSGDKKITAEDLGFGYEILCGISPRVKRYINRGKN